MAKGKKAKAKKSVAAKEMLVVTSKIKAYIRSTGSLTSGELPPALNEAVYAILDKAIARAKNNKRSTVKPQDV